MNLITWNCNMAFRNKRPRMLVRNPDILVVQKCENEPRLKFGDITPIPQSFVWIGNNNSKGVGVFGNNGYNLEVPDFYTPEFEYIIPVRISGKSDFLFFAIWAMPFKNSPSKSYVNQIWRAMLHYEQHLNNETILIGDFNSNAQWDSKYNHGNHSDLVNLLNKKNIKSLYHNLNSESHGKESQATIYLLKNKNKPYHMDYCFAPDIWITSKTSIEIGNRDEWLKLSDHMPIFVNNLIHPI